MTEPPPSGGGLAGVRARRPRGAASVAAPGADGRGRKPAGDGPGRVVPVRLDEALLAALGDRADRDHVSRSEAIRAAIRAYVA